MDNCWISCQVMADNHEGAWHCQKPLGQCMGLNTTVKLDQFGCSTAFVWYIQILLMFNYFYCLSTDLPKQGLFCTNLEESERVKGALFCAYKSCQNISSSARMNWVGLLLQNPVKAALKYSRKYLSRAKNPSKKQINWALQRSM